MRPYGGLIGKYRSASSLAANGMWVQNEHAMFKQNGAWPLNLDSDPYFNYTTLLLPGTGTNGANNNTFLDSSTNNFTVTRNGNTTQGTFSPFSQTGWGNYFDGTDSLYGTTAVVPATTAFTLEMFVYITGSGENQFFAQYSSGTSGRFILTFSTPSYTDRFLFNTSAGAAISSTGTYARNAWHHIVIGRDGSNNWAIWVNGTRDGTNSFSISLEQRLPVIGHYTNTGTTGGLNGYISNLRVITSDYYGVGNSTITVPTSPLTAVSGTVLLTCQSNRFVDNKASSPQTLTPQGDTSVVAFSPFAPTQPYSTSAVGGSGYFDGSGDYLSAASNAALDLSGDFTVEGWYYFNSFSGDPGIFNIGSDASGLVIRIVSSKIYAYFTGGGNVFGSSAPTLITGTWYHFAWSRSGSSQKFFINGEQSGTTYSSSSTASSTGGVGIGRSVAGSSFGDFNGYISSVRVVNGTAVYTTTFTPPTAPLTAITNTSLLLNFTNAGIYDATGKNVIETAGDAQVSTAQSKFGGGSKAFDGTGDYLVAPSSLFWTLGSTEDFTIEFWFYTSVTVPISGSTPSTLISNYPDWNTWTNRWAIATNDNKIKWYDHTGNAAIASNNFTYSVWNHVAVVRSSSSIKMYINGTQEGSTQTTNQTYTSTEKLYVSLVPSGAAFNGYIQDIRITKYARYTTNFSPPIRLSSIK